MIVRTIIYYSQARNKCVRNAMQTLKYLSKLRDFFSGATAKISRRIML